jgi:hypothetical protein
LPRCCGRLILAGGGREVIELSRHSGHAKSHCDCTKAGRLARGCAEPYFFCSIGAPQHLSAPEPPLVTITCEEHLLQI